MSIAVIASAEAITGMGGRRSLPAPPSTFDISSHLMIMAVTEKMQPSSEALLAADLQRGSSFSPNWQPKRRAEPIEGVHGRDRDSEIDKILRRERRSCGSIGFI